MLTFRNSLVALAGLALLALLPVNTPAQGQATLVKDAHTTTLGQAANNNYGGDPSLKSFLPLWEEAQSRFINGDPTLWKQHASQSEGVTIFGAFGGYERGWSEVGPRYDWAASQYKPSGARKQVEYLNTAVSGDMAFTVGIDHDDVWVGGRDPKFRPK